MGMPPSWFVPVTVAAVVVTAIACGGEQGVNDATSILAAIVIVGRERPECDSSSCPVTVIRGLSPGARRPAGKARRVSRTDKLPWLIAES